MQVLLPGNRHFPPEAAEANEKKRKLDDAAAKDVKPVSKRPSMEKKPSPLSGPKSITKLTTSTLVKPAAGKSPAKSSADMSFFGAGSSAKPKAPLPSFKKAPPAARPATTAASPSSTSSLLASTLSALHKRTDGPNAVTGPSTAPLSEATQDVKVKLNKKGHTVRFRDIVPDGGSLEQVRLFKEEVWELEMPFWKLDNVRKISRDDGSWAKPAGCSRSVSA
jgi:hypothetical protein